MPSICDPGENLIKNVKANGIKLFAFGTMCSNNSSYKSGFPSSKFIFEGFSSQEKVPKRANSYQISKYDKTTILFESPNRLKKLLNELKHYLGGKIQISRELTKSLRSKLEII